MTYKARLWKKLDSGKVGCRLCSHFCTMTVGERGKCGVRQNIDGELVTLVYDKVAAINIDPVEKKPLYHFLPGTRTFSIGTQGCNLGCDFCQNSSLSQPPRAGKAISGQPATPEAIVANSLEYEAKSISYTYSEPTVFFELMQDTAELAHKHGLKNILVSNGFQSSECLNELDGLMDAANIDIKAFNDIFYRDICKARLEPVLENVKQIHKMGWWLEITTLIIPHKNDDIAELGKLAGFIAEVSGEETPWHISRFHPDYNMQNTPPTPMETLKAARSAGYEAGLKYIYIGNISNNEYSATFCPGCGAEVISRNGFSIRNKGLSHGKCKECGMLLAGVYD
jgi:pyruvate formate lyase activating enzyme